ALVEHDVAALRAEGGLDGIGEDVHALDHAGAGVFTETDVLGSHCCLLRNSIVCVGFRPRLAQAGGNQPRMARMSSSLTTRYSVPSSFTSVPAYLPNSTLSPCLTFGARTLPFSRTLPSPTATTSPLIGFSAALSGMTMPPAETFSSSIRLMTTRS